MLENSPLSPSASKQANLHKAIMQNSMPLRGRTRSVLTDLSQGASADATSNRHRLPVISAQLQIKKETFSRGLDNILQAHKNNNQPSFPTTARSGNHSRSGAHSQAGIYQRQHRFQLLNYSNEKNRKQNIGRLINKTIDLGDLNANADGTQAASAKNS